MSDTTSLWELGLTDQRDDPEEIRKHAAEVGSRIAELRHSTGLTGQQLGDRVRLRKDQISKIESGKRRVDIGELPLFAQALNVSVGRLLGQADDQTMALAARLVEGAGPESVRPARTRARQLLEVDELLTTRANMPPATGSRQGRAVHDLARSMARHGATSKVTAQRQGRELADATRDLLDLGSDALGELPSLIERHFSVDVVLDSLGTAIDGLCVHSGDKALILASTDFTDGHVRFTLLHELGHHLFGDPRELIEESEHDMFVDNLVEVRANTFAGNLLMPEQGIRSTLSWLDESAPSLSGRALIELMEMFGVSLSALVYRLNTLKLMSYEDGQRLRRSSSIRRLVAENQDIAPTQAATAVSHTKRAPERYVRYALKAARSQRLGLSAVATVLDVPDDDALWSIVMGAEDQTSPSDTGAPLNLV